MTGRIVLLATVFALLSGLLMRSHPTQAKEMLESRANISTFGGTGDDNDIGIAGVNLKNWRGVRFRGEPVVPIAVHKKDGPSYIYKVLRVSPNGLRPFYGYVLDTCDPADRDCANAKRNGLNFLIDIHKSGWKYLGMNTKQGENYLSTGTFSVAGTIPPSRIPRTLWTKEVQSGKDYMLCGKWNTWRALKDCI